jgi:hypothetical protein
MNNYEIFWIAVLTITTIYSFLTSLNSKNHDQLLLGWFGYIFSLFIWIYILVEPNTPLPVNTGISLGDWGAKEYTHFILFGILSSTMLTLPLLLKEVKEILFKFKKNKLIGEYV